MKDKWLKASRSISQEKQINSEDFKTIGVDYERCQATLRKQSSSSYAALSSYLSRCTTEWLEKFLECDSLTAMFDMLSEMGTHKHITDTVLQLQIITVIKSILNTSTGLEHLLQDKEIIVKLVLALDTGNMLVKKQVFEMLSGICMYSNRGYKLAMSSLENFKSEKSQRYRFSIIINELSNAELLAYKTTILAFINAILMSTIDFNERRSIRNEFIGLSLLDMLTTLRHEPDEDLLVQINVFDEQKQNDDEMMVTGDGLDLNDHQQVFRAVFDQVANKPTSNSYLRVLQSLLMIDSEKDYSDMVWETIEEIVVRAVLITNEKQRLTSQRRTDLELKKFAKKLEPTQTIAVQTDPIKDKTDERNFGLNISPMAVALPGLASQTTGMTAPKPPPPPPPPPPIPGMGPPPPPPLPGMGPPPPPPLPGMGPPPPPPLPGMGPPPPPPLPGMGPPPPPPIPGMGLPPPPGMGPPPPPGMAMPGFPGYPGQSGPPDSVKPSTTPRQKMKKFQWNKIPPNVLKKSVSSVWNKVTEIKDRVEPDYQINEELFCQAVAKKKEEKLEKPKEPKEIALLDGKKSMNINIFLKQFKGGTTQLLSWIKEGNSSEIGGDRLKCLEKLLPESTEIETIKNFEGNRDKLGSAEKFCEELIAIPRIKALILKEDFETSKESLRPSIGLLKTTIEDILNCETLPEILNLILRIGNFMNHGSNAGNAEGFKISSLLKLTDTRANKPRMNLMHFIVQVAADKKEALLDFPKKMVNIESAAKQSFDNLDKEVNLLKNSLASTEKSLENAPDDVKQQMSEFFKVATEECHALLENCDSIKELSSQLALYFCEDPKKFKLEEFLGMMKQFCGKIVKAKEENDQFKIQEKRRIEREKKQAEEKARKEKLGIKDSPRKRGQPLPPPDEETSIIDNLLKEIRSGFPLKKAQVSMPVDENTPKPKNEPRVDESKIEQKHDPNKSWKKAQMLASFVVTGKNENTQSIEEKDEGKEKGNSDKEEKGNSVKGEKSNSDKEEKGNSVKGEKSNSDKEEKSSLEEKDTDKTVNWQRRKNGLATPNGTKMFLDSLGKSKTESTIHYNTRTTNKDKESPESTVSPFVESQYLKNRRSVSKNCNVTSDETIERSSSQNIRSHEKEEPENKILSKKNEGNSENSRRSSTANEDTQNYLSNKYSFNKNLKTEEDLSKEINRFNRFDNPNDNNRENEKEEITTNRFTRISSMRKFDSDTNKVTNGDRTTISRKFDADHTDRKTNSRAEREVTDIKSRTMQYMRNSSLQTSPNRNNNTESNNSNNNNRIRNISTSTYLQNTNFAPTNSPERIEKQKNLTDDTKTEISHPENNESNRKPAVFRHRRPMVFVNQDPTLQKKSIANRWKPNTSANN